MRRPKLSTLIVQDIKRRIVDEGLKPGERFFNERELVAHYGCSKGTAREVIFALETEGLLESRTGPAGGSYVAATNVDQAARGLRNYLHFQNVDSQQIYQLRKIVEVELAVSVVGHLDTRTLEQLSANVEICATEPKSSEEQWKQRVAELEFHNMLAASCPNPLLAFTARFINDLLRDLVRIKNTINPERQQFGAANCRYHSLLLEAYLRNDACAVREIMSSHMCDAEEHMGILEAEVDNRFLLDSSTAKLG